MIHQWNWSFEIFMVTYYDRDMIALRCIADTNIIFVAGAYKERQHMQFMDLKTEAHLTNMFELRLEHWKVVITMVLNGR